MERRSTRGRHPAADAPSKNAATPPPPPVAAVVEIPAMEHDVPEAQGEEVVLNRRGMVS